MRLLIECTGLIVSVILSAYLAMRWQRKAHVIAYTTLTGHIMRENGEVLSTHSLIFRNVGKKEAKNLQVMHLYLPKDFQVLPVTEYSIKDLNDGKAIVFPIIAPNEQITICYAYPGERYGKIHGPIKHDEGLAEYINVLLTRQYSEWVIFLIRILILVGVSTLLYLFMLLIKSFWFLLQT